MALRTSLRAPRLAFETFNEATDLVWGVTGLEEGLKPFLTPATCPKLVMCLPGFMPSEKPSPPFLTLL